MHVPDFEAVHKELSERQILCDFRPDAGIRSGRTTSPATTSSELVIAQIGEIRESGAHERHLGVVARH